MHLFMLLDLLQYDLYSFFLQRLFLLIIDSFKLISNLINLKYGLKLKTILLISSQNIKYKSFGHKYPLRIVLEMPLKLSQLKLTVPPFRGEKLCSKGQLNAETDQGLV